MGMMCQKRGFVGQYLSPNRAFNGKTPYEALRSILNYQAFCPDRSEVLQH